MTIPHAPFELLLYGRDGRIQIRQYENLLTAVAAIDTLRPALLRGYSLSLVLHTGTLHDAPSRTEVRRSVKERRRDMSCTAIVLLVGTQPSRVSDSPV